MEEKEGNEKIDTRGEKKRSSLFLLLDGIFTDKALFSFALVLVI